jgi:hypothetical protein
MCAGLFLSYLHPDTFGHFGDFTRERRGEVTFWYAVASNVFLSAFAVYGLLHGTRLWLRQVAWVIPWATSAFVILMTFTRIYILLDLCGFCTAFFFYRPMRRILIFAILPAIFVASGSISYFILAGNDWEEVLANESRLDLWSAHLSAATSSPFFGVGNFELGETFIYGNAVSEIGMLAWASRYGLLFAGCMLYIALRGVRSGIRLFTKTAPMAKSKPILDIVCPVILFTYFFGCAFSGMNRILEFGSFAFYYALFYCHYRVQALNATVYRPRVTEEVVGKSPFFGRNRIRRPLPSPSICRQTMSDCAINRRSVTR